MCGVTRMDKISNEEIRRRVGVQNYVMRLFGDVERMDDEEWQINYTILECRGGDVGEDQREYGWIVRRKL